MMWGALEVDGEILLSTSEGSSHSAHFHSAQPPGSAVVGRFRFRSISCDLAKDQGLFVFKSTKVCIIMGTLLPPRSRLPFFSP